VASCDGPVRFRRILNTAYGHKPEGMDSGSLSSGGAVTAGGSSSTAVEQHRSQQSVSYSFHQQMARAISSQQRQLSHQQQEESENSGDATGAKPQATGATASSSSSSATSTNRKPQAAGSTATSTSGSGGNQELYVCVYCKHTFKSQYCYQKHAKRHLNPLSLTTADKKLLAEPASLLTSSGNQETDNQTGQNGATAERNGASGGGATAATSALLRREVRPLDMNVQYSVPPHP